MEKWGKSAINVIVNRRASPLDTDLYRWCAKNTYLAPSMTPGMLLGRGMLVDRLSATFVARLMLPRTARLEANAVGVCSRGHIARDCTTPPPPPMSGALPQPILLLMLLPMCQVYMLRLLRRFRPFLQLPLVAGDLKLICTIANVSLALKVLESVPSSLHHNSCLALVTLLDLRRCGP